MARPSKLTPKVRDKIVEALRRGCYADTAAELAGISQSTYYSWLERGRAAFAKPASARGREAPYAELVEAVMSANAEAEADAIDTIRRDDDWRAAAFFLERRFPDRWRRRESHELTGADGGPIETRADWDLSKLSDDELEVLQRLREKAADGTS